MCTNYSKDPPEHVIRVSGGITGPRTGLRRPYAAGPKDRNGRSATAGQTGVATQPRRITQHIDRRVKSGKHRPPRYGRSRHHFLVAPRSGRGTSPGIPNDNTHHGIRLSSITLIRGQETRTGIRL